MAEFSEGEVDSDNCAITSANSWFRWKPTSMYNLVQAERKILKHVWNTIESKYVSICNDTKRIWTIVMNKEVPRTPLVLVHGMGSGVGLWTLNLENLSSKRPVYAFDVMGFGRSSRPKFSSDPVIAEMEFVESIEEWRKQMNLDKFVLLGHSLGGFLAASYALRYPDRIKHLVLVDPWGFAEKPADSERKTPIPVWIKIIATIVQPFNPLGVVRAAGPWGPSLIQRFRPDLLNKFGYDDNTVSQYIYHCNAQNPSGEIAFKHMHHTFGYAKYPMINRIGDLDKNLPLTMIYGAKSWVDSGTGYQVKYLRDEAYVDVQVVRGAGHHVYADKYEEFNSRVNRLCDQVDEEEGAGAQQAVIQAESAV